MVLHHKSPHCPFSIRRVLVGPAVIHPWRLQFLIKSPAWSFLHVMCTCRTILHLTCTYGTCSYSSVTLVICHKSLRSIVSPSDVYLRDSSPSDQWDLTAYVSCVPVEPFSISIRPLGPNGLRVTCTSGTIRPLGLTAYVSRVPVGPFSISIQPVGPDG
jgi:hypothetical protein